MRSPNTAFTGCHTLPAALCIAPDKPHHSGAGDLCPDATPQSPCQLPSSAAWGYGVILVAKHTSPYGVVSGGKPRSSPQPREGSILPRLGRRELPAHRLFLGKGELIRWHFRADIHFSTSCICLGRCQLIYTLGSLGTLSHP